MQPWSNAFHTHLRYSPLMRRLFLALILLPFLHAQWIMQPAPTTAGLRGIHALNSDLAWTSGTNGTILRTTNGGQTWQNCSIPSDAEQLDFRAVQAFNETSAIIMSAGKGDLSRIYKTTDACRTWKLLFTNPDKEGFWDALQFSTANFGVVLGDPVDGHFPIFVTSNGGKGWRRLANDHVPKAKEGQAIFAASNSSLFIGSKNQKIYFVTGGGANELIEVNLKSAKPTATNLPGLALGPTAGAFSLGVRTQGGRMVTVTVGGDYKLPGQTKDTASSAVQPPSGFRSAVAYDTAAKHWIAVGPNGTDISTDDGVTWRAQPGAEQNWNALSLPFVVGPKGRIGKLTR